MAKIAQFFSYLHQVLISVPTNGYHNISRVVNPQMRSICESFQATNTRSRRNIPTHMLKNKSKDLKEGQVAVGR